MDVKFKDVKFARTFGIELEVCNTCTKDQIATLLALFEAINFSNRDIRVTEGEKGWAETSKNLYWHVKYDSTCGFEGKGYDSGWEIASYIGKSEKDLVDVSRAASCLGQELTTSKNCGLHMHVGAGDFTPSQMATLLAWWIKIEDVLFKICEPHRENNYYCKSLRSLYEHRLKYDQIEEYDTQKLTMFWIGMQPYNTCSHENDDKKVALNSVGYKKGLSSKKYSRKTVELRLPECLLQESHVLNWSRLFLNFVDFCKLREPPEDLNAVDDIEDVLYGLGLTEDQFTICGNNILDTKLWLLDKIRNSRNHISLVRQASEKYDFISDLNI